MPGLADESDRSRQGEAASGKGKQAKAQTLFAGAGGERLFQSPSLAGF
jgi:hypothetical protein